MQIKVIKSLLTIPIQIKVIKSLLTIPIQIKVIKFSRNNYQHCAHQNEKVV